MEKGGLEHLLKWLFGWFEATLQGLTPNFFRANLSYIVSIYIKTLLLNNKEKRDKKKSSVEERKEWADGARKRENHDLASRIALDRMITPRSITNGMFYSRVAGTSNLPCYVIPRLAVCLIPHVLEILPVAPVEAVVTHGFTAAARRWA